VYARPLAGVHLAIVGDGAERSMLEAKVRDLGLEDNIHFIGLIPKYAVAGWYRIACASFVVFKDFPVWGTVSPNKMFDSFAAGVPIIQNTGGWIRDLVDREDCGLNAAMGDPSSMAACIRRLASDSSLRDELGRNARRLAEGPFNRDRLAETYRQALLDAIPHAHAR
jgi:glycosyltransferase involved in cell wall biosynthesis